MKTLADAKNGKYVYILDYQRFVPLKIKRRLLELGLTQGQKVKVVRRSVLGKAYLIEVRGYTLSLRKSLASFVLVGELL